MIKFIKTVTVTLIAISFSLFLTSCELTDKPVVGYSVDNQTVSTQTINDEIKELKDNGAIKLWESNQTDLSKKEKEQAKVAAYLRFRIYADYFEIVAKSEKVEVKDQDKKTGELLLKLDFGIANVGHQKNLKYYNKISDDIKERLIDKYAFKAAYIRTAKFEKVTNKVLEPQINQFKTTCESKQILDVIAILPNDKKSFAKDLKNKMSFLKLSNKYNSELSAAIQGGFLSCFISTQFEGEIGKKITDAGNDKIVGPFTQGDVTFYARTRTLDKLTTDSLKGFLYFSNLDKGNTDFLSKVNKYAAKKKPILNKKYGYVNVSESGINITPEKPSSTNTQFDAQAAQAAAAQAAATATTAAK